MCLERLHQRGFTLASGIFLVVILAALGAFLVNVTRVASRTQNQDLLGNRAYQAARAGLEWGMFNALRNNTCDAGPTAVAPGGSLSVFTVTVTCGSTVTDELGAAVTVDTIVATACNQAVCAAPLAENYVERQLSVMVVR